MDGNFPLTHQLLDGLDTMRRNCGATNTLLLTEHVYELVLAERHPLLVPGTRPQLDGVLLQVMMDKWAALR